MDRAPAAFDAEAFPDVPLYNIQAVSAATGVPAITLRSWERRYGVPRPKRDPKGYRLYSERDIALTGWLKERVQQGVGISRAVNMLRLLELKDVPPAAKASFDFDTLQERLLVAVSQLDDESIHRVVGEGLMVASVEEVCLELLQPVLYEIGRLWSEGDLTVTMEHVGSNLIRTQLAQLMRLSASPIRRERIMVGCAPGEQHDIGALMLALFLRRRGYDVVYVGANVESRDFLADVERVQPAAICLSAGSQQAVDAVVQMCHELRAWYRAPILVGGRGFKEAPELRHIASCSYGGDDADAAAKEIESLLTSAARHRTWGAGADPSIPD